MADEFHRKKTNKPAAQSRSSDAVGDRFSHSNDNIAYSSFTTHRGKPDGGSVTHFSLRGDMHLMSSFLADVTSPILSRTST